MGYHSITGESEDVHLVPVQLVFGDQLGDGPNITSLADDAGLFPAPARKLMALVQIQGQGVDAAAVDHQLVHIFRCAHKNWSGAGWIATLGIADNHIQFAGLQ